MQEGDLIKTIDGKYNSYEIWRDDGMIHTRYFIYKNGDQFDGWVSTLEKAKNIVEEHIRKYG